MPITCSVFCCFSLMQSLKSLFLENYQFLDIHKWQYLESASNSTLGIKFLIRLNEIWKSTHFEFCLSTSAVQGHIQSPLSRKILTFAEEDILQRWMGLAQERFEKFSNFRNFPKKNNFEKFLFWGQIIIQTDILTPKNITYLYTIVRINASKPTINL